MKKKIVLLLGLVMIIGLLNACSADVNTVSDNTVTEQMVSESAEAEIDETTSEAQTEAAPETTTELSETEDESADYEVSLERKSADGRESAVITARTDSGEEVWTITTDSYDVSQLNQIEDIGIYANRYYYIESGTVKAINLTDGSLAWENKDFKGSIAEKAFAFGDDGNLYLSGYLEPDLFIVDKDGKTKKKISSFSEDYYWPYELDYRGDKLAITYEGTPENKPVALLIDLYSYTWNGETESESSKDQERVVLGDEQFEEYLPLLEGKKVALFSNQTGIVGNKTSLTGEENPDTHFGLDAKGNEITYGDHILDALLSKNVNVVAVFSPEHGFRGTEDAGATIEDSVDEKTGVPILSLYENEDTHSPAKEDMDKFDTLVVDMQDVGLRYYTYYLSMYYLMDACAKADKEFIILDRPNPNGFYVDGPILQEAYKSNVGQLPIPVVYGMTWGELSQMINGEGWLSAGKDACKLTVIPCKYYTHQTKTSLIRNPSPNLKDMRAVYLYASTCFFENTQISVGRGTDFSFEVYGSPYLKGNDEFTFTFTPKSMSGALEPPFMDETCYGKDLRGVPVEEIWDAGINLNYLVSAYEAYQATGRTESFWGKPYDDGLYWIDKLSGSDALRKMIDEGKTPEEIKASWQEDIQKFKEQRKPYMLYEY